MAGQIKHSEERAAAFVIAQRVQTERGGLRAFRTKFPELPDALSRQIFDKAWERSERVKYMTQSNQGWFINRDRIGCPEGANSLFYNFLISFVDEDGNSFDRYFSAQIGMMRRIGANNEEAFSEVLTQMSESNYFRGWEKQRILSRITSVQFTNVNCIIR